jgi:hypothetical protein
MRGWILFLALGVVLVPVTSALAAHSFVNSMFPTPNYNEACVDTTINDTNGHCRTDNATLTAHRETSLEQAARTRIGEVLVQEFDGTTDLSVSFQNPPVTSGSAETDIMYQRRSDIPGTLNGLAWCNDGDGSHTCDQHYAAFRTNDLATKGRACHESGHGVGLLHGDDSDPQVPNDDGQLGCLQQPIPSSNTGQLGVHMRAEINQSY